MNKNILKVASPIFQIFLITVSLAIVAFTISDLMNSFRTLDPEPKLENLNFTNQSMLKNSSPIEMGFYVRGFYKFDLLEDEFIARGVIWFIYDSTKISKDVLSKFSFFRSEQLDIDTFDEKDLGNNKKLIRYFIKLKFASNLNFSLFPLEDHRVFFVFDNKFIDLEKNYITVKPDNFKFEGDLEIPGWESKNKGVKVGYSQIVLDNNDSSKTIKFPRIIFYLDFKNEDIKDVIIILLPLFIMFYISTFLFSLEYAKHDDLIKMLLAVSIPAIISYRFVIDNLSPKVSYFMFVDYIFALFIILAFLIFILNFYMEKIKEVKPYILIILYGILNFIWVYLLYR